MNLKKTVFLTLLLKFVLISTYANAAEYLTYHCFIDDHLNDHKLIASIKAVVYKKPESSFGTFKADISPETLSDRKYAFHVRYLGEFGKKGFSPVPLVEVGLYDKQKEIYSITRGEESSELYTSFVNEDLTRIEVYCSTRKLKK
jgi:hypothetical protein